MKAITVGDSIAALSSGAVTEALAQAGDMNYVLANPGTALLGNNLNNFDWRTRITEAINDFSPDYVIVFLGTNDAGRGYPNPAYQNAMKLFIDRCGGRKVYWCNVMDFAWNTFWFPKGVANQNWALDDLWARRYAGLIKVDVKAVCNTRADFREDGLHPSPQGVQKIAAGIRYVIGR